MSDEEFICKYIVKDGQIVDADAVPVEVYTCAVLTCSVLLGMVFFALGVMCGILF